MTFGEAAQYIYWTIGFGIFLWFTIEFWRGNR